MADQPRYEPLEASAFFDDGMSARPLVPGTVARGQLELDDHFYRGQVDGQPATALPREPNMQLLKRGRERFDIFCSHCHDHAGTGQGTVVRRGFPRPPSYHIDRLRAALVGHLFDVITNGIGRMPEHGSMIPPHDRWAIVAYIRALQLSQYTSQETLSPNDLQRLGQSAESGVPETPETGEL
jgi:hypothetical protein